MQWGMGTQATRPYPKARQVNTPSPRVGRFCAYRSLVVIDRFKTEFRTIMSRHFIAEISLTFSPNEEINESYVYLLLSSGKDYKANMNSYIQLQTAAIFFLSSL